MLRWSITLRAAIMPAQQDRVSSFSHRPAPARRRDALDEPEAPSAFAGDSCPVAPPPPPPPPPPPAPAAAADDARPPVRVPAALKVAVDPPPARSLVTAAPHVERGRQTEKLGTRVRALGAARHRRHTPNTHSITHSSTSVFTRLHTHSTHAAAPPRRHARSCARTSRLSLRPFGHRFVNRDAQSGLYLLDRLSHAARHGALGTQPPPAGQVTRQRKASRAAEPPTHKTAISPRAVT